MSEVTAIVIRGCVDVPDGCVENFERKGRTAALAHTRRYYPGELVSLPSDEIARLISLGVLRAV